MPSRDLNDLRLEFRILVVPWLADWRAQAAGYNTVIACTLRTFAEQQVCWNQGRTTPGAVVTYARPGQSAHQYGLAIDVYPLWQGKLVTDESDPIWQELGNFAEARGIQWYGAPGSEFHEMPHFQHPRWRTIAAAELAGLVAA